MGYEVDLAPYLKPLPRRTQWWRRTARTRAKLIRTLGIQARKGVTLAVSVGGATLISYGVWRAWPPAGFVTAGILCWVLLWSAEKDRGRNE